MARDRPEISTDHRYILAYGAQEDMKLRHTKRGHIPAILRYRSIRRPAELFKHCKPRTECALKIQKKNSKETPNVEYYLLALPTMFAANILD
jgi:hypothetical protein